MNIFSYDCFSFHRLRRRDSQGFYDIRRSKKKFKKPRRRANGYLPGSDQLACILHGHMINNSPIKLTHILFQPSMMICNIIINNMHCMPCISISLGMIMNVFKQQYQIRAVYNYQHFLLSTKQLYRSEGGQNTKKNIGFR